jgi:hypothetical protein
MGGQLIGYQHGITAMMNRLRDMDPEGTVLVKSGGKWPSIDTIPVPLDQWKAYDKAERAFTILCYDHDQATEQANGGGEPEPQPPQPPTSYVRVAPKTVNYQEGSNARYCCVNQPGVTQHGDGTFTDEGGGRYDENGLHLGGRSSECEFGWTQGLPGARELDQRDICRDITPVGDPTKNTGSWLL